MSPALAPFDRERARSLARSGLTEIATARDCACLSLLELARVWQENSNSKPVHVSNELDSLFVQNDVDTASAQEAYA